MTRRFYVTTPIYYVNSSPHVGTAYTTVLADAFARYHRMRGDDVHFLTGTDEHGLKLEREARARDMTPKAFVDEMSARFREVWPKLDVLPSDFVRTTEARHEQRVQAFWKRCADRGDIYLGSYEGLYCVACEELKTEKDLLEGNLCPVHHRPVEKVQEPSYFFRLSNYTDRLLAFYERHPAFIQPETRRNEVISFVREGLKDLSVSRTSFTWGIPVPEDPKHVMYVWFDALLNYLTALEDGPLRAHWPPDLQLVGKDIVRFHAVYWPAFLMSAGYADEALPKTVYAHGFLLSGGRKFAKTQVEGDKPKKSPGTSDPLRIAEVLGADVYRYFILREVAFGQDGEFSHEAMIARARSELTETVGNLLNRALPFAKHFDGKVPLPDASAATDADRAIVEKARSAMHDAERCWDELAPHRALEATIDLARAGNKYFDESAPWALAKKGERARLSVVIYNVLELVRTVAVALWPVIPRKSDELRAQLGLDALTPHTDADLWPLTFGGLSPNSVLTPGQPVFPKYDKLTEAALLKELGVEDLTADNPAEKPAPKAEKPAEKAPEKPAEKSAEKADGAGEGLITYDDFAKVELKLARVLTAERVPKKDMLLKLSVDAGDASGPRTIIAGIAQSYAPEALVGKQIVIVANLAPRDFGKGLVSHGMLLACGPKDALSVVTLEKDQPAGTRVK